MSNDNGISKDDEQILAAQMASPEAVLTIHQDAGNAGRVMFSLDLSGDDKNPDEIDSIPACDLIAMALFTTAMRNSPEFQATYQAVAVCIDEMTTAQMAGADGDALRAIREKHNVYFRVG